MRPSYWAYKRNCAYPRAVVLINHFVVIIIVLVYNFKLRAAYFILIILLCSPSRSAFVQSLGWKRTKEKKAAETGVVFIFVVPRLPRVRAVEQNSEIRRHDGQHLLWPPRGCICIHKHNGASWYMRPRLS